jgi:hypothetical protein
MKPASIKSVKTLASMLVLLEVNVVFRTTLPFANVRRVTQEMLLKAARESSKDHPYEMIHATLIHAGEMRFVRMAFVVVQMISIRVILT